MISVKRFRRHLAMILLLSVVLTAGTALAGTLAPASSGQLIYVAIYSHIYSGDKEQPMLLAATLSIRNTDPDHPITISTVDYYDSDGHLLKRYLDTPLVLGKLASVRYVVKESDTKGGSGANFMVRWESAAKVNPPLVESVMIGTKNQQGLSFTSRGQVVEEK